MWIQLVFFGFLAAISLSQAEKFVIQLERISKLPETEPTNNTRYGGLGRLFDQYGQAVTNTQNIWYKGIITVGTPPQPFNVMFDTGSDLLWIPARGCTSSGAAVSNCRAQNPVYTATSSSTARNTGQSFSIAYGLGSAQGTYYQDAFAFGSPNGRQLKYPQAVTFGAAQQMTFFDGGIFGLSFPTSRNPNPIFYEGIRQRVFDQAMFTAYFANCPSTGTCQNGGTITLGGFDSQHCSPNYNWIPVVGNGPYWQFNFQGISAGSYSFNQAASAITDTGKLRTSYVIGPQAQIQQLAAAIGAQNRNGAYFANCNAQFTIYITINGYRYPIQASTLMIPLGGSSCQLALSSGNFGFWIFGAATIRNYCVVHDIQNRRVAFAPVLSRG
ncbi:Peptidase A1 domain-containing protein [Aphelenchoides besseyi]|nr:Peptidase A1 domain-containing protein [Aphelenchoides besseyi]KAI6220266.1 Peptidase A1 domain-containing protein [Aphelenchoides besseyi]